MTFLRWKAALRISRRQNEKDAREVIVRRYEINVRRIRENRAICWDIRVYLNTRR